MIRRTILIALSTLALASGAAADHQTQDGCPYSPERNDVVARPLAVQSYADAYNIANAHYLVGTADPATPVTITSPLCPAGGTTIGRAGYVGSFDGAGNEWPDADGNDINAVYVFDASQIVASARHYGMRFSNIQNFVGNAFTLTVKILDNRGDAQGTPGARGAFNRTPVAPTLDDPTDTCIPSSAGPPCPTIPNPNATSNGGLGPQGAPNAGVPSTVIADTRSDRGDDLLGTCAIPARGHVTVHDSGIDDNTICVDAAGLVVPCCTEDDDEDPLTPEVGIPCEVIYTTFDRQADVPLAPGEEDSPYRNIRDRVRAAQNSAVEYFTCRYTCLGPQEIIPPTPDDPTTPDEDESADAFVNQALVARNVDCNIAVRHALYVGVSAAPGGDSSSAERLQDSLLVDNIIHLSGDSDFCADGNGGTPDTIACQVYFVSKM